MSIFISIKNWFNDISYLLCLCYLVIRGTIRRLLNGYSFMGALDGGERDAEAYHKQVIEFYKARIEECKKLMEEAKQQIEEDMKQIEEYKRQIEELEKDVK